MEGAVFAIILALSVIALCQVPVWYGCFRKKFLKFEIGSYFYVFSSAERLVTASLIICLSPGFVAAGVAAVPLLAETLLIAVRKPYVLG
jgi:hypothetical protein